MIWQVNNGDREKSVMNDEDVFKGVFLQALQILVSVHTMLQWVQSGKQSRYLNVAIVLLSGMSSGFTVY